MFSSNSNIYYNKSDCETKCSPPDCVCLPIDNIQKSPSGDYSFYKSVTVPAKRSNYQ